LRRDLTAVAARAARHGRGRIMLYLSEGWHREHEWMTLVRRSLRPARKCGLTGPDLVAAARSAPAGHPGPTPAQPAAQTAADCCRAPI
jgi:hypothetical protein